MSALPTLQLLESIAIDGPAPDPFVLSGRRGNPYTGVHLYRQVGDDWFSFRVHSCCDVASREIRWLVSMVGRSAGVGYSHEWEHDRADLHQMFWLSRHGLKAMMLTNGQPDLPQVDDGNSYSKVKRAPTLIKSDLAPSLMLELYRINSPFYGYGGTYSFNEQDVCINTDELRMETPTCKLDIRLAQSPLTGLWGYATDYETKLGGYSGRSSPLTSRNCRFQSRQEAIGVASRELKKEYAKIPALLVQIDKVLGMGVGQLSLF